MKQTKKLTRKQKEQLSKEGYNPKEWGYAEIGKNEEGKIGPKYVNKQSGKSKVIPEGRT